MFKRFALFFAAMFFAVSTFALGPSQIWRLEVSSSDNGIVEISELQLSETVGGSNATQLFLTPISFTQATPLDTWTVNHDRGTGAVTLGQEWDTVTALLGTEPYVDGSPVPGFPNDTAHIVFDKTDVNTTVIEFEGDTERTRAIIGVFTPAPNRFVIAGDFSTEITPPAPITVSGFGNANDGVYTTSVVAYVGAPSDETRIDVVEVIPVPGLAGTPVLTYAIIQATYATTGTYVNIATSKDSPSADKKGVAVPAIQGFTRRPEAAAFDNNLASWFKTTRAPSITRPLAIQYTFWIGDKEDSGSAIPARQPGRWPNVVEYSITAPTGGTAPRNWKLMFWLDGAWQLADEQAGINWPQAGGTQTFSVD